ncbi:MAG: aziB2 [Phycisphaerales bacterium]|nr:aziB2 [Phycisphaerales bacterium]
MADRPDGQRAKSLPTARRVLDIASGYEPALILESAVRLVVFDALDARPLTLAEVVERTKTSTRGMRALLDALVGMDLLERDGNRYALTDESAAYLVSTSPTYQGYMCKHVSRHLLPRWLRLTEVVRSGRPEQGVNEQADGGAYFREFVEDIFPMSYEAACALADELGVADARERVSVLDLAAGSGVWSIALAEASPRVRVTAVDWPAVLPVTRRIAARHGVADRFDFVEGNLLETDFGHGHQIATLGHILHSEGAQRSQQLIRKTFDALAPGGTIVIAEFIVDEDRTGPPGALIFAVTMLVNTDAGDTFTYSQMAQWLQDAGFQDIRELDAPGPAPLILATKPTV